MTWKCKLFKDKKKALNFIEKNQNKNGFRYIYKYNGEFYSVEYKFYH